MLFILLTSALLALSQQPQTDSGRGVAIHGEVRQAGSQNPIPEVDVTVVCGAKTDSERTDDQGRYRSEDLPAGACTVKVTYLGIERERTVVIRSDMSEPTIDFWLPVPGRISGRVLGEHDEPLAGVRVYLLERSVLLGGTKYAGRGGAVTDAHGEYAIAEVAANRSLMLLALPSRLNDPAPKQPPDEPERRPTIDAPAFYPSSPRAEGAISVRLQPGEQRVAADIHLERTKPLCVSGTVESKDGPIQADVRLVDRQIEAGALGFMTAATTKSGPDGQFRICDVPAGGYKLIGYHRGVEGETAFYGSLDVDPSDRDLRNLRLLPDLMMALAGTAAWDGDAANLEPMKLNISLSPWNGTVIADVGGSLRPTVSVPGTFRWPGLRRDAFRPILTGLRGFAYVKSMTNGGHDLKHELLRVGEAFEGSEMRIVLGADGGKIFITAVDDKGRPLPDMTVLVSPAAVASPTAITDELVEGVTDKDGVFTTGALAPGKYRVLVRTESVDRAPESLPGLAQALAAGEAVELAPKSVRDVRITVR